MGTKSGSSSAGRSLKCDLGNPQAERFGFMFVGSFRRGVDREMPTPTESQQHAGKARDIEGQAGTLRSVLCKQIRSAGQSGVLILTAKGDESDRIVGLELGADDYLTKPFSLPELLARIRAVLRRYRPAAAEEPELSRTFGPFTLDLLARELSRKDERVELTRTEFDLLERLTRWPGRVFTREELLDAVRGGETEAFDRAVDRHVSNLRAKIEEDPRKPAFLQTVWGVGYRWSGS